MYINERGELLEIAQITTSQRMRAVLADYYDMIVRANSIAREIRNCSGKHPEKEAELKELLEEATQLDQYYENLKKEYYSLID